MRPRAQYTCSSDTVLAPSRFIPALEADGGRHGHGRDGAEDGGQQRRRDGRRRAGCAGVEVVLAAIAAFRHGGYDVQARAVLRIVDAVVELAVDADILGRRVAAGFQR